MNKKAIFKNNNVQLDEHPRTKNKHNKNHINLHLVNHIKQRLGVQNLSEIHMSNILNLKVKDVEDIERGHRELSIKDIDIICNHYNVDVDYIYDDFKNRNKY